MNKIFSNEIALLAVIGMFAVIIFAFYDFKTLKSNYFVHDYSQDPGYVKAASTSVPASVSTYTEIVPTDVVALTNNDPNMQIVDVSAAYKSGHIPNALSLPLKEIEILSQDLDKNKTYILYCRNNIDSLVAIQKLVNLGFKKLYRISGGFNAWVRSGYKIEK